MNDIKLTDNEGAELLAAICEEDPGHRHSWCCVVTADAVPTVEAILAARLARVEALADEWERLRSEDVLVWASRYIADLRAVLDPEATT